MRPLVRASIHPIARGARFWLGCLVLLVLAVSCDRGSETGVAAATRRTALPPGVDLSAVMRRVHFAFRAEGGTWSGGLATYAASASASDLRITPRLPGVEATGDGPSLVLSTRSVSRDGIVAPAGSGGAALRDDGTLEVDRGAAVEHLENTEEGVEQSFAFDEQPRGRGDLEVRLAASGLAFAGATDGGLHFGGDESELGVRYGNATWIDAAGRRSPLPVRYERGEIVITVSAALVEESAYPARIDPTIGPELGMDNPVQVSAWLDQNQPAIAFGDTNYLVVWFDNRRNGAGDMWATRVSPAGAVLDTSGIPVWLAPSGPMSPSARTPTVTWGGNGWLITWINYRSNTSGDLYGARVSPAGALLDPNGFAIDTTGTHAAPSVAWDGANYLVAYAADGTDIKAVRVSPSGTPVGAPVAIATPGGSALLTNTSFNGTNHLVAYSYLVAGSYRMGAKRVSPAGVVLDGIEIPITSTTGSGYPFALASNGVDWLVAWAQNSSANVYGARIRADGTPLDVSGLLLGKVAVVSGKYPSQVTAAYGGNAYAVFWSENDDVYGARVSTGGVLLGTSGSLLGTEPGASTQAVVAYDGTNFMLAFRDDRLSNPYNNPADIFALRISGALAKVDAAAKLVSQAANTQSYPAVAYNGTNYLVVWADLRAVTGEVAAYGTRVSDTGTVLDPAGLAIAPAPAGFPQVESNGTDWLVAWVSSTGNEIRGRRVGANGALLDGSPITINSTGLYKSSVGVGSNGSSYLVAWTGGGGVNAARVLANGTVVDTSGFNVASFTDGGYPLSIPFNGVHYLLTWTLGGDIYAARVATNGVVVDAGSFAIPVAVTSGVSETTPVAASDGSGWLVTWIVGQDIRSTRISANGTVLDPAGFSLAPAAATSYKQLPWLAWDGAQYWATWVDLRTTGAGGGVYGARVTGGASLDPSGVPLVTSPGGNFSRVAAGKPSQLLLTYTAWRAEQPFGAERVFARFVSAVSPDGSSCAQASDCTSGFCADGVCCDQACTGACQACSSAKKGGGQDGICGPVAAGTDPDNECAQQASSTCGTTGTCNGAGACQLYPAGTSCGASVCQGSVVKGQICDGNGACVSAPAGQDCAPYACAAGSCKNPCTVSADCVPGYSCLQGACLPSDADGMPCTTSSGCQSAHCVDGVCCATACNGVCQACSAAKKGSGADGVCGPIMKDTDPDNECAVQAPSTCKQNGLCDGNGACALYPADTECAPASCAGGVETKASTCDGAGTCVAGAAVDCVEGYACVDGACATSCTDDTSCAPGYACDSALQGCVPAPDAGAGGSGGGASSSSSSGSSSSSSSGSGGAGGSGVNTGGSPGAGGGSSTTSGGTSGSSNDKSGCGCRLAGEAPIGGDTGGGVAMLLALLGWAGRRDRSKRGRAR